MLRRFERAALLNAGERFIVVDFTASWCGPCKMIAPHVEALAQEFDPAVVTVAKVDVDENREVAAQYNIQSMPTFLFFRHGEVLFSFGGADPGKLRSSLSTLMANAFDKYTGGTNVIAHGLKSAAKYNGAHGKVERFDWKCDRYVVRFDGADAPVSLRPANLMPVVACDPVPDSPSDLLPGERGVLDGISDDGTKYVVKRDSKGDKVQISLAVPCWRQAPSSSSMDSSREQSIMASTGKLKASTLPPRDIACRFGPTSASRSSLRTSMPLP